MLSHGGNIRQAGEEFGKRDLIDFSASINPLGPSRKAVDAIGKSRGLLVHYPDTDSTELREALAAHLGVRSNSIIAGNGSVELIYLAARVLKPARAAILIPTFLEYERALRGACRIEFIQRREKDGFAFPFREVTDAVGRADLLFLCNPNNPTGDLIPKASLAEVVQAARRKGTFLVVDETFIDFCLSHSVLKQASRNKYLIVLRSFSKLWGIPGLRLGYAVSHPETIGLLNEGREPWTVNVLAQAAGVASLKDRAHFTKSVRFIKSESMYLFEQIARIPGLKPYPPDANFLFVKIEGGISSSDLRRRCGKRGIIIRDCSNFRGLDDRFIRLAVRTRRENLKLLAVLREIMNVRNESRFA